MLNIIMKLDISARLTLQVTIIICHNMKKILLKKKTLMVISSFQQIILIVVKDNKYVFANC